MESTSEKGGGGVANEVTSRFRRLREAGRVPAGGWLKAMREARGVAQTELAAKLGFKRQAWAQFEASEARGAISLTSLRRAADALGCNLVYAVVPREERSQRSAVIDREENSTARQPPMTESLRVSEHSSWIETELPTELR